MKMPPAVLEDLSKLWLPYNFNLGYKNIQENST
jgi:hypothetical protein